MSSAKVSVYKDSFDITSTKTTTIFDFLNDVRNGTWQDIILYLRASKDEAQQKALKKKLPSITISGWFEAREDGKLKEHSNYIGIDIDNIPDKINEVKERLGADPYVLACFTSARGNGLCAIFKIEGGRHYDAFLAISSYIYLNYGLVVDPSGKNVSRLRYASFDPNMVANPSPKTFKEYLKKPKERKLPKIILVKSDFDDMVNKLAPYNICEDYQQWISIGYALISEFGEEGRQYFHLLSSPSMKYDHAICDKQFDVMIKAQKESRSKTAKIATVYYFAKLHGIPFYSEQTKKVASSTTMLKRTGLSRDQIRDSLEKNEGVTGADEIIDSAMQADVALNSLDCLINNVQIWLLHNFTLSRNVITRKIENDGIIFEDTDFNTVFLECKKLYDDITFDLFSRIIFSRNIRHYNPFFDFFTANTDKPYNGEIEKLFATVQSDNAHKLYYFGKKWLVSIMSSIHGEHSPLMMVLAGEKQNTGKTEFFRRLLPVPLRNYYAESKLDAGKDDEILMCQKLIVMDDEMGGKSKREAKRLKELTSKQTFSLREPYGRSNVDLVRLAVLCGTSNDLQLLNDPTGNRRIIPIEVISVDHAAYNSIDKTALFMELYRLYKAGFEWRLNSDDIARLNSDTSAFVEYTLEYELITKYFEVPKTQWDIKYFTNSDIKVYLETRSGQKLSGKKIGEELRVLKFERISKKVDGNARYMYAVHEKSQEPTQPETAELPEELPF